MQCSSLYSEQWTVYIAVVFTVFWTVYSVHCGGVHCILNNVQRTLRRCSLYSEQCRVQGTPECSSGGLDGAPGDRFLTETNISQANPGPVVHYTTELYNTLMYNAVVDCTLYWCIVQYATVLYNMLLYCTLLYSNLLFTTGQLHSLTSSMFCMVNIELLWYLVVYSWYYWTVFAIFRYYCLCLLVTLVKTLVAPLCCAVQ